LGQIRKNILRSVEAQTVIGPDRIQELVVLGNAQFFLANEIKTQGATMTNFNIKFGDYATIHGDFVVAQSIQDSFNTLQASTAKDELKAKLEELTKEVAEQSKSLPETIARELAEDLNTFVKESVKQSPRRKWYELSADGIMQAATTLGAASGKIIGMVKDVLALLAGT
jgi:predicted metal-dependent hydrolase